MQITLSGHHVDITDSLRNYVDSKFNKLERHFEKVTNIHVIVSVEKLVQKAEANLHFFNMDIHAEDTREDMYAAIDGLVDKLDRMLKKQKEKQADHRGEAQMKKANLSVPQEEA